DDLVFRLPRATAEAHLRDHDGALIEPPRLLLGSPARRSLCQLWRLRGRRGRGGHAAAASSAASSRRVRAGTRQVLACDPVAVGVEVVGVTWEEVFLSFSLVREVCAVVIERLGRGRARDRAERGDEEADGKESPPHADAAWAVAARVTSTRGEPGGCPESSRQLRWQQSLGKNWIV